MEYSLVLAGWVIGLLFGTICLAFKTPLHARQAYYNRGKNITGIVYLLFGLELFFQWLIRFYVELHNLVLSVSVYLFTYCAAVILIAIGFCTLLAPSLLNKRQYNICIGILAVYSLILLVLNLLPARPLQVKGIIAACVVLFIINCTMIYNCIMIYRKVINDLRTYYSDVLDNLINWMPGVGIGVMLLFLAAPITCLAPREVGIYQLAMGIILMVYIFLCIINFYFRYDRVAAVFSIEDDICDDDANEDNTTEHAALSLSESLCEVLQEKEKHWQEQGRYREPGLTIEQAARDMGTNRNYLSRYLNQVRHMTFYEWVAQMRIEEAQTLMANSSMTMEQIAAQVGFSSYPTFSSTFKKVVGITPNRWRNNQ